MMPRRLVRLKGRGWLPVALVMAYMFVKNCEAAGNCPHPSVPFAAKYSNLTGGPDQVKIKAFQPTLFSDDWA